MKKGIKCLEGALLSVCLAALCVGNVFAEEGKTPAVYDSGTGYTALKITHPHKDIMTTDGIVDYTGNGTPDVNLEKATVGRTTPGDPLVMGTICISEPAMVHGPLPCSS